MTEGDTDNLPALETLDQEEAEGMAEETEFCSCTGSKTKASIKRNNNKCPNTDCGKKLTDIQGYDTDESTNEPTKIEQSLKILTDWLDAISSGQLKGNRAKGNSNDQNQNAVRIKPSTFQGSGDLAHFFIKLKNFIDISKIKK